MRPVPFSVALASLSTTATELAFAPLFPPHPVVDGHHLPGKLSPRFWLLSPFSASSANFSGRCHLQGRPNLVCLVPHLRASVLLRLCQKRLPDSRLRPGPQTFDLRRLRAVLPAMAGHLKMPGCRSRAELLPLFIISQLSAFQITFALVVRLSNEPSWFPQPLSAFLPKLELELPRLLENPVKLQLRRLWKVRQREPEKRAQPPREPWPPQVLSELKLLP